MSPEDARRAAALRFGGRLQTAEAYRDRQRFPLLDSFSQDLRYAVRSLRASPAFTAVAVLTLAIGIGATTAIFSTVNATLLRPLPFPHPDELISVRTRLVDGQVTIRLDLARRDCGRSISCACPVVRRGGRCRCNPFDATLDRAGRHADRRAAQRRHRRILRGARHSDGARARASPMRTSCHPGAMRRRRSSCRIASGRTDVRPRSGHRRQDRCTSPKSAARPRSSAWPLPASTSRAAPISGSRTESNPRSASHAFAGILRMQPGTRLERWRTPPATRWPGSRGRCRATSGASTSCSRCWRRSSATSAPRS